MNLNNTLASVIQAATGYPAIAMEHDPKSPIPSTIYDITADMPILSTKGEDTKLSMATVQLMSLADTYSIMMAMELSTETALFAKTTDWQVSVPLSTKVRYKENNIFHSVREYIIWYTKD